MKLLDTCILISAVTIDTHTQRVLQWFDRHVDVPLAVNDWTRVETASALLMKQRQKLLTEQQRINASDELRLRSLSFHQLELTRDHFALAHKI